MYAIVFHLKSSIFIILINYFLPTPNHKCRGTLALFTLRVYIFERIIYTSRFLFALKMILQLKCTAKIILNGIQCSRIWFQRKFITLNFKKIVLKTLKEPIKCFATVTVNKKIFSLNKFPYSENVVSNIILAYTSVLRRSEDLVCTGHISCTLQLSSFSWK